MNLSVFVILFVVMCIWSVDERDGLAQSLHQSEQLVQDKQATVSQMDGHTAALQSEISSLKQNKDEVSLCHVCHLCLSLLLREKT